MRTTTEHYYCDRYNGEVRRRDGVRLQSSHFVVRRALPIADLCPECYRDLREWLGSVRQVVES